MTDLPSYEKRCEGRTQVHMGISTLVHDCSDCRRRTAGRDGATFIDPIPKFTILWGVAICPQRIDPLATDCVEVV